MARTKKPKAGSQANAAAAAPGSPADAEADQTANNTTTSRKKKSTKSSSKKGHSHYGRYIHRVLKQVHPACTIGNRGMAIMESMVMDLMDRLATESAGLMKASKKKSMAAGDMKAAVRLNVPGELGKHATSEGLKATTAFTMARPRVAKPQK